MTSRRVLRDLDEFRGARVSLSQSLLMELFDICEASGAKVNLESLNLSVAFVDSSVSVSEAWLKLYRSFYRAPSISLIDQ